MNNILCIETATSICSVALFCEGILATKKEDTTGNAHSKLLTVFINEILLECKIKPSEINYVAVSSGPGSYTGLRIGVSAAKGLCYGLSIPLIMVPTTESLAAGCLSQQTIADNALICGVIDARRMEVYQGFYDNRLNLTGEIEPHIITENSYLELLQEKIIHFCGNGAFKLQHLANNKNAHILNNINMSAEFLLQPVLNRIEKGLFSNLAYDEPLYLKEFEAKKSKPYFDNKK